MQLSEAGKSLLSREQIFLIINRFNFQTDEKLNRAISEYAYGWYNQIRPHSFNDYQTPF